MLILLTAGAAMGLAAALYLTLSPNGLHLVGIVDANQIILSAQVPGRIERLLVEEGQEVKATICGSLLALLGSTMTGVNLLAHPASLVMILLLIIVSGFTLNAFMFLMVGNINDPMVPKILSGILNTLLYFPSGAIYPVESFPPWMRLISRVNPMTYSVHGFRALMLKDAPALSVLPDVLFLVLLGALSLVLATRTFKRTL